MLGKIIAVCVAIVVILLTILLQTTSPTAVGPFGILMVFILLYMLALGALTFLLFFGSKVMVKTFAILGSKRPVQPFSLRKAYYFSSVTALAPIMFLAMQSVGEVGIYDIILVVLFVVFACVYISKRTV